MTVVVVTKENTPQMGVITVEKTGERHQKEINHTVCRLNELVTKVSNARTGLLFASVLGEKEQTIEVTIKVK